mmetsp:Transcript_35670/g.115619  ORF Transcript_35670/g.115619 Transcript_35670/m.115619 type:complete len:236 (+) Transcript_35670:4012-4719(+)
MRLGGRGEEVRVEPQRRILPCLVGPGLRPLAEAEPGLEPAGRRAAGAGRRAQRGQRLILRVGLREQCPASVETQAELRRRKGLLLLDGGGCTFELVGVQPLGLRLPQRPGPEEAGGRTSEGHRPGAVQGAPRRRAQARILPSVHFAQQQHHFERTGEWRRPQPLAERLARSARTRTAGVRQGEQRGSQEFVLGRRRVLRRTAPPEQHLPGRQRAPRAQAPSEVPQQTQRRGPRGL